MNEILEALKDFVCYYGEYQRPAEGALSWQHLLFVGSTLALMVFLAVYLGKRNRGKDIRTKSKPLMVTAFLIDGCELLRIVLNCIFTKNPLARLNDLPFYLCSIHFFTIPIAAFSKGRIKQIALDFILIFGMLGAVAGTIGAFQNYASYPVLSIKNVVSGITHAGAGFAGLYIPIAKMHSMKKKDIPYSYAILIVFCIIAYAVNIFLTNDAGKQVHNYMFLMSDDGTPYSILSAIFGAGKVFCTISVVLVFVLYIALFYGVYYLITNRSKKANHPGTISA